MAPETRAARLRFDAAGAVVDVVGNGMSLERALARRLAGYSERDYALGAEIAQGTVRWFELLRAIVRRLLAKPDSKLALPVEALIAAALYQIRSMRVPDHAAVGESVAAVAFGKHRGARGLVNAVLRRYLREREAIDAALEPAALASHPTWLAKRVRADWPEQADMLLAANNERAPMWLRVNRQRLSVADYRERLTAALPDLTVRALTALPDALCLDHPVPVAELPGFAAGDVSVQDGGAQIAALWLGPEPGQRILDACAAPGNKTGHIAEIAGPTARITALDSDEQRLGGLAGNLERLGHSVNRIAVDAAATGQWWDQVPFERILLDAPCSATGVIRRHPDIKYTRRSADLPRLAALQARLLVSLWPTLAAGGRLVYATCSVLRQENERIVQQFVDEHSDARICRQLPDAAIQALMTPSGPGYQLITGRERLDGFFYACLEKSP